MGAVLFKRITPFPFSYELNRTKYVPSYATYPAGLEVVVGNVIVLFGAMVSISQPEGIDPPFSKLSAINGSEVMVGTGDGLALTYIMPNVPFPQLLDGKTVTSPELPGVDVNVVPDPMFGDQSAGAVQLYEEAFTAVVLNVNGFPAQPEPGPVMVACPGTEDIVTFLLPAAPLPQLLDGVAVTFPELPGVVEKLVPVPVFGDQSAGAVQLYDAAFEAVALNVNETPVQPVPGPVTVAPPGTEFTVTFILPSMPSPQLLDGVAITSPELPGVEVNVEPDPVFGDQSAGAFQLYDVAFEELALNVNGVPAQPEPGPVTVAAPGTVDIVTFLLPVEPTPQEFDGNAVTFPELPGVDVKLVPDPVFGDQSAGAVQTNDEAFEEVALNVNGTPIQPEPGPEIVAGPGKEVTVTLLLPAVPFPQPLDGVAVTFPELPGVDVKLVPEPEFGDQSAGAVQLNDVAFVEVALNVNGTPVQPEPGPVIVAAPGKGVTVTFILPAVPFPQLFDGMAVTFPELPGVDVKLVPDPVFGDQSAGAVQLNDVAFEELALNVNGVPAQPDVGPVTVAAPGKDVVTVT